MRLHRQTGAAIIVALLVVAIVSALAAAVVWRQDMWVGEIGLRRDLDAARGLARGGTDWAKAMLAEDARLSAIDHRGEPWATRVPPTAFEGGEIGGAIEDQQGRWNLNNLVRNGRPDPAEIAVFQRLLQSLGLPQQLADAVVDWADADGEPFSGAGAEDDYYLALDTPYRAANAAIMVADELRAIRGFSPVIVEKLRPFVTALPEYAPINVNTASRPVLAAALPGIDDAGLDLLMTRRDRLPFRDLGDFRSALPPPGIPLDEERFSTASAYFAATISARHGDAAIKTECLIRRRPGRTDLVWQRHL